MVSPVGVLYSQFGTSQDLGAGLGIFDRTKLGLTNFYMIINGLRDTIVRDIYFTNDLKYKYIRQTIQYRYVTGRSPHLSSHYDVERSCRWLS